MRDFLPRAMDRHIDLGYEGPEPGTPGVQLEGNRTLLKEIISNLLDNATNYTPSSLAQPGVVTARVIPDPFGQVLVLQVEDNGPGIPASDRELVFQPFYRVLGTNVDGSGLGLSIVREIAQQHRAEILVEDAHPHVTPPGTRISVRFVLDRASTQGEAPAPGDQAGL